MKVEVVTWEEPSHCHNQGSRGGASHIHVNGAGVESHTAGLGPHHGSTPEGGGVQRHTPECLGHTTVTHQSQCHVSSQSTGGCEVGHVTYTRLGLVVYHNTQQHTQEEVVLVMKISHKHRVWG